VQALHSDPEKWEAVLNHAGSPAHIMAMNDSIDGGATCKKWDLGEAAGHFLPYHAIDFWMNLALCHALLVDKEDGSAVYQVRPAPLHLVLHPLCLQITSSGCITGAPLQGILPHSFFVAWTRHCSTQRLKCFVHDVYAMERAVDWPSADA
jgi:hypothetical protein